MSGRETSNDQCVVQCSWIDACTGRRCVLHQGHAATGVQGGHDVYGLDTSDLTPEQEIDRLVAARTGPGRPMVQRPNEAPTRPSCASCAGPAPGKYCTSCVMSGRASAHDRQELTDEIERLRVVIKTGGAMYRAERLALECGMGGMPPDEPRTQEATPCSPTDEYEKRAAMWLDRMTTTKRHDNVNYETLGALLAEVVAEHRPDKALPRTANDADRDSPTVTSLLDLIAKVREDERARRVDYPPNKGMTTEKIREAFEACRGQLAPEIKPLRHSGDWREHVVFMCEEGASYAEERREKAMRWLGFVQGALWARGVTPIDELKNMNRPDTPRSDSAKGGGE